MPDLLQVEGVSKSFPGVQALDGVRFDLRAGEVHALMGENGAGKSTLIKILCGVQAPDGGTIRIDGETVRIGSPPAAHALGIGTVHQELQLQPYLSVAENIFLGRQPVNRFGIIDRRSLDREATRILGELGVRLEASAPLGSLSIAERQVVAIARAVSQRARILIFDEPTSSLTRRETELLLDLIRRLRGQGIGVIYVSHRMEEIFALCDRVTVFRDGRHVATGAVAELTMATIIQQMIGRALGQDGVKSPPRPGATVLEVEGLTKRGVLQDISLSVRRGEIVCLAGLVGAGRTELARAIFGDLPFDSGTIRVDGSALKPGSPRLAIAAGLGLVPEDRKEQGLVTSLSIRNNISMPQLSKLSRLGVLSRRKEAALARSYTERLAIRTPSIDQRAGFLSGGNQQRVVIGKWLATRPKLLIVDEPTRGIDVGAKAEIHRLLRELVADGMAILMISSDLPEVLAISDRILVLREGRLVGELQGEAATQEAIMSMAVLHRQAA